MKIIQILKSLGSLFLSSYDFESYMEIRFHRWKMNVTWSAVFVSARRMEFRMLRTSENFKKKEGILQPISLGKMWSMVSVDVLGLFPRSRLENTVIIVCTEYVSSFAVAGKRIKVNFWKIMGTFGAPRSFLSDRGTVLNGQMLTDLLKLVGVAKDLYHPQTNGLVEKYNKTLVKMLTCIQLPARRIVTYTYHTCVQHHCPGYSRFSVIYWCWLADYQ